MAFDKIQAKAIDTDSAPERGSVTDDDFVLIRNANTGEFERVKVSSLLSGTTGSIRLSGEADFTDPATTLTTVVINGDPDNTTITQGTAPTDPSPIGVAYLVKAASGGTTTEISGTSDTVFTNDQLLWSGTGWTILSLGQTVTSVNGQTGAVTIDAISETQADAKYALKTEVVPKSGGEFTGDVRVIGGVSSYRVKSLLTGEWGFTMGTNAGFPWIAPTNPTGDVDFNKQLRYDPSTGFWQANNQDIYTVENKPTPADIGALSTSYTPAWNTITGKPSLFPTEWDQVSGKPVTFPADWTNINGRPNNFAFTDQNNSFNGVQNFYGQVRVFANDDTTVNHQFETVDNVATYSTDAPNAWRMCGPNATFLYANHFNSTLDTVGYDLYEKNERVYSPNNKPTATDVGALAVNELAYGIKVDDTRDDEIPTDFDKGRLFKAEFKNGSSVGLSTQYCGSLVFQPWADPSGGSTFNLLFEGDNIYFRRALIGGESWSSPSKLYHERNKPTPEDIGAPDANDVYTKAESDSRFAPATHDHDNLYYTKAESDSKYLGKTATASDSQALEGRTYTQVVDAASQGKVPDTRTVNGKELSADISITKGDVGLSQVNNWPASSATNLDSTETYATSSAVKQAYDRATQALENSGGLSVGPVQLAPFTTGLDRDKEWPGQVYWSNKEVGEARQATAGMGSFFNVAKDRNDTLLTGFYRRNRNGYVEVRAYYRRVL